MRLLRKFMPIAMIALLLSLLTAPAVWAKGLLRDPDIEYALNRLAKPIYEAAGLSASRMKIVIVQDDRPNAFVADNQHIFLHSDLILRLESASQLQAVIAHEVAHITGGHITRRHANVKTASGVAALGILLSGAVVAATGDGKAAAGA